mgnify:CR=1 FL=1
MGSKYIRNTDDATIVCKIPSDKNKVFIFKPKKIDKRNNILLSNGFTEVSEEDLELLRKESSTFMYYENAGRLSMTDDLPEEAMSPEQLINSLREENERLRTELAENSSTGDQAEAQKALQNALAEIEEQKKTIEVLEEQLVAAQEELQKVDSDKPETAEGNETND